MRWHSPAVMALCALAVMAPRGDAAAAPPVKLPQARINRVDVSAWPKVRVLATMLDRGGRPVQVKAIEKLDVRHGKLRSHKPYVQFVKGVPLEDRKDGKMWPADKAGLKNAAVVVVAGYQHESLRRGSMGRRLKEGLGDLFKGFGKTDRANIIWYGDRLYTHIGLKGKLGELADIEENLDACVEARALALSGREIDIAPGKTPPPPGTDLCGLSGNSKDVAKLAEDKAFFGYFPRLFNLGLPFFSDKRYCKPPRESLNKYGQITPENAKLKYEQRDNLKQKNKTLDYETSAFDEAMHLMLRDARADENKFIVLLSDGVDGYFRELDLCREAPPQRCAAKTGRKAREACVRDFLKDRLLAAQLEFKRRAEHWIGICRASGVRVFAVGMASLGRPFELERLRLLAERTGGTYREAEGEAQLGAQVAATTAEVLGQLVIDFEVQEPEEEKDRLTIKLDAELDPTMVQGRTSLTTRAFTAQLPPTIGWQRRVKEAGEDVLISAQEALGYKVYVIVGIALICIFSLIFLIIGFLITRKILRWFIGLFSRGDS